MLLVVGKVGRPHGLRGEVLVNIHTDEPAQRFAPGMVLIADPGARASAPPGAWQIPGRLTVQSARPHQGRMIVVFDGVGDRDLAEQLRDVLLWVDSADLPASGDPDEFSDHQLIGLAAVDPAGEPLGEVLRVDHAPASDLLVLRRPDGRTALVPFVQAIVPQVDVAGGRVVVTPPEGLFDL
jgi:16S rRNA processing protein RimM